MRAAAYTREQAKHKPPKLTSKQTTNQTSIQTGKQATKRISNQTSKQTSKQANKQPTNQAGKQTNSQTNNQTTNQATNQAPTNQASKQPNNQTGTQRSHTHADALRRPFHRRDSRERRGGLRSVPGSTNGLMPHVEEAQKASQAEGHERTSILKRRTKPRRCLCASLRQYEGGYWTTKNETGSTSNSSTRLMNTHTWHTT
jgi:hypothetical protein